MQQREKWLRWNDTMLTYLGSDNDFRTDLEFRPETFHGIGGKKLVLFRWISSSSPSKHQVAMMIELYGYDLG